jgi:4-hydroxybutyryl-CoA dehydratase/vinylacetyl-CoA-Delta-isomerase
MGEKVKEFMDEPIFQAGINAMAATYEIADEDPSIATTSSKISGVTHSRFSHITESVEDVVAQNIMQRKLGQRTGTCFQRCVGMDALNATFSTTFDIDKALGTDYHQRFKQFAKDVQTQNLVVGGAMTDPKGNRDKGPAGQDDPDMFVHVVGRTAKGVVIRGCKVHQTGTLNSHWMLVMPGQRLSAKEKDYGVCVALPTDAEGITYIHGRQPADLRAHFENDNEIDLGNAKFGGQEVVVVFDDVFCPFSHVFMDGEIDYVSPLVERFTNYHRRSYICKAGLGDVLLGAAATMAEYNGAAKASHVKDKLVEMAYLNENIAGTALAASHQSVKEPAGNFVPDAMFANVCKHNVTRFPYLTARIAQDLAGGLLVTLPHSKDFDHPVTGPLLNKYLTGAPGTTVENRRRMLRLIENMTMGRNCVGYMAESMHGAGSPQAQRVMIQRLMEPKKKMEFAKAIAGITK